MPTTYYTEADIEEIKNKYEIEYKKKGRLELLRELYALLQTNPKELKKANDWHIQRSLKISDDKVGESADILLEDMVFLWVITKQLGESTKPTKKRKAK